MEYARQCQDGSQDNKIEKEIAELEDRISPKYLNAEIPQAIYEALEGVERVSTIVHSMKPLHIRELPTRPWRNQQFG
jgi:hypothetical protein